MDKNEFRLFRLNLGFFDFSCIFNSWHIAMYHGGTFRADEKQIVERQPLFSRVSIDFLFALRPISEHVLLEGQIP